jgi:hypothetical protein
VVIPIPATTPFLYKNQNQEEAVELLDAYDRIKLSLSTVAKPASKDEYEDYNSQESYDPSKKGALA